MRLFIETFGAGFMGGMPRGLAWKGRREGSGIDFFVSNFVGNSSFQN